MQAINWKEWWRVWSGEYVLCRILQHSLGYSLWFATRRTVREFRQMPEPARREAVG